MVGLLLLLLAGGSMAGEDTAAKHYRLGSAAFVEHRFDAAIDELKHSLALDPRQLPVTRLLGLSYQLAGRLDEAEAALRDACKLAPKDAESWFYLGRVHYVRNYFNRALSALETAARYGARDPRIRECLALTLEALGDAVGARREYEESVRWNSSPTRLSATPYLNYGVFLLKLNDISGGERLLEEARRLTPKDWRVRFEMGRLYSQTGRLEAAVQELNAALESGPTPEDATRTNRLLGGIYYRLGRDEDAARVLALAERQ